MLCKIVKKMSLHCVAFTSRAKPCGGIGPLFPIIQGVNFIWEANDLAWGQRIKVFLFLLHTSMMTRMSEKCTVTSTFTLMKVYFRIPHITNKGRIEHNNFFELSYLDVRLGIMPFSECLPRNQPFY